MTSNIICQTVKSYEVHPVTEYIKNGQPFTICVCTNRPYINMMIIFNIKINIQF